jgi:hypothetical protein
MMSGSYFITAIFYTWVNEICNGRGAWFHHRCHQLPVLAYVSSLVPSKIHS